MRFLHSIAVPERAVAADAVESFDLPVNPLSALLINIRPLNETATLANYANYREICAAFNRITVSYRGASVVSMRGEDLAALNFFRHGIQPREANADEVDNERRSVCLPLLFGRWPYDPHTAFPASKRGELVIEFDIDIADTGYDGFRYNVESIELLGANPKEYERRASISRTFAATGDNDIELPLGNTVRGLLLWGTTPYGGAAPAPSWGRISTMLDNQEVGYADTDWESAMAVAGLLGRNKPPLDRHVHTVNAAGAGIEQTTATFEQGNGGWENYVYLDFDPTRDDLFSIDTKGASTFMIRANAETADAVRCIPVEQVKV